MPGSNPLFGLNTLGGALSLETKTGFSDPGAEVQPARAARSGAACSACGLGGARRALGPFRGGALLRARTAGGRSRRRERAQRVRAGTYQSGATTAELSLAAADTTLTGNGPAPAQLLAHEPPRDLHLPRHHEEPDVHGGRCAASGRWPRDVRLSRRRLLPRQPHATVNGDQADWPACTDPARRAPSAPPTTAPRRRSSTAPATRRLRRRHPYDAAENTTRTRQNSYGVPAQVAVERPLAGRENHLFVGASGDEGRARFRRRARSRG